LQEFLEFERGIDQSFASQQTSATRMYYERSFAPGFLYSVSLAHRQEVVAYCAWLVDDIMLCQSRPEEAGRRETIAGP